MATMSPQMFLQSIAQSYGITIIAAATVWKNGSFPFASGSIITSQGNVLQSYYRTRTSSTSNNNKYAPHLWNDGLLLADVPVVPITSTASYVLPKPIIPTPKSTIPPDPMCSSKHIIGKVKPGEMIIANTSCGSFTCSVRALASSSSVSTTKDIFWTLFVSWGYYFMPDGNDIYYFEQFCSLYQCNDDSNSSINNPIGPCMSHPDQITDDHGGQEFEFIEMTSNIDQFAVVLPMSANGNGTVELGSGLKDSLSLIDGVTNLPMKSAVVEKKDSLTTVRFKPTSPLQVSKRRINLSVMGRSYNRDYEFVNTTRQKFK